MYFLLNEMIRSSPAYSRKKKGRGAIQHKAKKEHGDDVVQAALILAGEEEDVAGEEEAVAAEEQVAEGKEKKMLSLKL